MSEGHSYLVFPCIAIVASVIIDQQYKIVVYIANL